MNILLVNPNRFKCPPVIPIGLEYLLASLRRAGHQAVILDLCFEENPVAVLKDKLESFDCGLAGGDQPAGGL